MEFSNTSVKWFFRSCFVVVFVCALITCAGNSGPSQNGRNGRKLSVSSFGDTDRIELTSFQDYRGMPSMDIITLKDKKTGIEYLFVRYSGAGSVIKLEKAED